MPIAQAADGEIFFESSGQGQALMLISGLGGVSAFWREQVAAFSTSRRVIVHDHRGTGRSTHSRIKYSIEQMSRDAIAVMDTAEVERAIIVGHSTGGAIAQYLAAHFPARVSAVVLGSTWSYADAYFRALFETRAQVLRHTGFEAYQRLGKLFCFPPPFLASHPHLLEPVDGCDDADIVLSRIEALIRFDSRPFLHRIQVPSLVIGARDDMVTPPHLWETLKRGLPGCHSEVLDHGGHFCPQVVPAEYNRALERFFRLAGQEN
ncbi:alpha/beta fold hydrolase [Polaromonas eurypsychrophila]|uniref:Alpha/beta hydrolase n=1 Tax=Polaromonas eurypsychrophila TaxID=1614635 RepID=A0A916SQG1_9BURK|nr:alpha/beta fold hydrolase [Polaromonas eurypsychrophila]GGB12447.1 alpha/beta hydrolase [Polaromonas eurypsychrophila]